MKQITAIVKPFKLDDVREGFMGEWQMDLVRTGEENENAV